MANPKPSHIQEFFGMENKAMTKSMYKLLIPNINHTFCIYIPMLDSVLDAQASLKYDNKVEESEYWPDKKPPPRPKSFVPAKEEESFDDEIVSKMEIKDSPARKLNEDSEVVTARE